MNCVWSEDECWRKHGEIVGYVWSAYEGWSSITGMCAVYGASWKVGAGKARL